ncbi:uncharacterized protein A1O9_12853 [Exophiala aquamarina CBS 119918]|uniref:VOC domain-containing protein n=1 Tax=Exophiala aquamarina CBS 119918 TaxID=1182545 RepID=A0A072P678_9EURO|nr:uncharacterized protein A1O9_12853 [Exophiala aquamarina CBS 119918]KEF51130.1 hypothetical protein A1O9_12853 [Exophiala aquamarina CBS 119918]
MSLPGQIPSYNRSFNHVGVAVPDCEAAVKWYTDVMGFRKLRESVRIIDRSKTPDSVIFKIYDDRLQVLKLALLTTGNGVGFELFEFVEPKMTQCATFDYTRGGVFHVCFTDPNPDLVAEKVVASGGKKFGDTVNMFGSKERAVYLQDPWGNVFEVMSCNFDHAMANRPESPVQVEK